jgi:hypothetical protein
MNKKIVDYKILRGSLDEISQLVKIHIGTSRWQPFGSMQVMEHSYHQPIVRYEDENVPKPNHQIYVSSETGKIIVVKMEEEGKWEKDRSLYMPISRIYIDPNLLKAFKTKDDE